MVTVRHKNKAHFKCALLVGREGFEPSYSNENRFRTTIVFTTIINMFVVWTFSSSSLKMLGVKSLHSEYFPSSGLSSANTVKTSPN